MNEVSMKSTTARTQTLSNNKKNKSKILPIGFASPSTKIWNSRISWRITFVVFLTIMFVQAAVLALDINNQEKSLLNELSSEARAIITPLIDEKRGDDLNSPIDHYHLRKLTLTTHIKGIVVYSQPAGTNEYNILDLEGLPVLLTLRKGDDTSKTYYSQDGKTYEDIMHFTSYDSKAHTHRTYFMAVRMDATSVRETLTEYVKTTIILMCLMSFFVTSVLMAALGRWLLEPILFMRNNLKKAFEDPENPKIPNSPFNPKDEIGGTIELTQNLINQNAENIHRIKSAAQDKIHKLAYFDSLTGLPNRILFVQKMSEMARDSVEEGNEEKTNRFAVVTVDLDHFKDINDSMGHNVGDAILRAVGKRLRLALPDSAIVARTGEDEFAITAPLSTNINTALDIGERVQSVIRSEPFKVFNENFEVRASIGVSTYPDDSSDPDQVLKNADIALNRAKEEGRDTIRSYLEDFDKEVQARFQMLRDLRDAMEHNELQVFFQPQLDLTNGKVIGAETLIRWWKKDNSKEGGHFISPVEFIPIAEQSGLIVPIGEWVLEQACQRAVAWHKKGYEIRVAVNVSAAQFLKSDIVSHVNQIITETGINPHLLELEVTESVFMSDINHTIDVLNKLHSLGVELAIDDFGTGYSSLSYLRQFPIDRLKIDQSFIRNALNDPNDASITRTIIRLGHSLNLKVIAEGVETKEHEDFLISEQCDEVQGFRYSKPVPDEEFNNFMEQYNGNLSAFDK